MPRYVAFLRAINVGGHTVKMDRLRELLEALRFRRVETVIASGNVLFDTAGRDAGALERRIERHLEDALGFAVATFVRSPAEVAAAAAYEPPFAEAPADGAAHELWVGFLKAAPTATVEAGLLALRTPTNEFHVHGRELYWRRVRSMELINLGVRLERTLGAPMTVRNVTTVRKLAERAAAP